MFNHRLPIAALCLSACLALAGCGRKKQAHIPTPPAPLPAQNPASLPSTSPQAPPQPTPAEQQPAPAEQQPATQPPPARHRSRPTPNQTAPAPTPAAPTPSAPPAPITPPRLGTLLTPERQQALNQEIDQSLSRARRNLASLAGKNLDAAGREAQRQIQSFIEQAQKARASDLEASRSLAERADLLSRDLLRGTGQ